MARVLLLQGDRGYVAFLFTGFARRNGGNVPQ
jgi:hypothetical protein